MASRLLHLNVLAAKLDEVLRPQITVGGIDLLWNVIVSFALRGFLLGPLDSQVIQRWDMYINGEFKEVAAYLG